MANLIAPVVLGVGPWIVTRIYEDVTNKHTPTAVDIAEDTVQGTAKVVTIVAGSLLKEGLKLAVAAAGGAVGGPAAAIGLGLAGHVIGLGLKYAVDAVVDAVAKPVLKTFDDALPGEMKSAETHLHDHVVTEEHLPPTAAPAA